MNTENKLTVLTTQNKIQHLILFSFCKIALYEDMQQS